jgi:hypothetical protein
MASHCDHLVNVGLRVGGCDPVRACPSRTNESAGERPTRGRSGVATASPRRATSRFSDSMASRHLVGPHGHHCLCDLPRVGEASLMQPDRIDDLVAVLADDRIRRRCDRQLRLDRRHCVGDEAIVSTQRSRGGRALRSVQERGSVAARTPRVPLSDVCVSLAKQALRRRCSSDSIGVHFAWRSCASWAGVSAGTRCSASRRDCRSAPVGPARRRQVVARSTGRRERRRTR